MHHNVKKFKICMMAPFILHTSSISNIAELLSENLEREGHTVLRVSTKTSTPFKITMFLKLLRVSRNYDIIHVHCASYWGVLPALMGSLAGKICNKRIVTTYHGGAANQFFRRWIFFIKPFFKQVTITVPSQFLRNIFENFGLTATVIPNILDLKKFQYKGRPNIKPKLLFAKHLKSEYNPEMGIKAFKIVKSVFPQGKMKIVGSGPLEDKLKNLIKELKLDDVEFVRPIAYDKIPLLYSSMDICINCSNVESFGMVIVEAFACGLPVVSTDVGGISSIIQDNINGLLVFPNDHKAMAKKVIYLLENPNYTLKMTENARKWVEENCAWESVKHKLLRIYEGEEQ